MKRILLQISVLVAILSAVACTSEESKVKALVEQGARGALEQGLDKEIRQEIPGRDVLRKTYLDVVLDKSVIEVGSIDLKENFGRVNVEITTIPSGVRKDLINIMNHLEPWKDQRFNVSDAIDMVIQKRGGDSREKIHMAVDLKKENSWRVIKVEQH